MHCSVDSFVVKTDVHFSTDISLLFDSMRKALHTIAKISNTLAIDGWRQFDYHIRSVKSELRRVQKAKKGGKSSNPNEKKIETAHRVYVEKSKNLLAKIEVTKTQINCSSKISCILLAELFDLDKYIGYANHQIDLIERRVFKGEVIPHNEKIFSIFEPHTRWISKGKAGVFVEFGVPVSILKDQHGFILNYQIMKTESDVDVAVPILEQAKKLFSAIKSCSYDKGYWSVNNHAEISKLIEQPIMPKKGRPNKQQQAEESSPEFVDRRHKHSAVESSINGLNHTGLDKCYNFGITGFERCVGLSILSRNIHNLGKLLIEKEKKKILRKPHKKSA